MLDLSMIIALMLGTLPARGQLLDLFLATVGRAPR